METKTKQKVSAVVAASMAAAIGASGAMAAAPAYAAVGDETGTLKIKSNGTENTGLKSYDVYKIFTADVEGTVGGNNEVATHIQYADGDTLKSNGSDDTKKIQKIIEAAATQFEGSAKTFDSAQEAAEYITDKINRTQPATVASATNHTTQLASNTFGAILARGLVAAGITPGEDQGGQAGLAADTSSRALGEGYYLVVSDSGSTAEENGIGTSPIFAVVNHAAELEITAKASTVPTVDKVMIPDAGKAHSTDNKIISVNTGEEVLFQLTGTLPDNYASYPSYFYKFTDTLDEGLAYGGGSPATVKIGSAWDSAVDVTSQLTQNVTTTTANDDTLTITINDLKTLTGVTIDKDSKIFVQYKAKLTEEDAGLTGLNSSPKNTISVEYSNDPEVATSHGTTAGDTSDVNQIVNYQMKVVKVDRTNESTKLAGTVFNIKKGDKFVNQMGSLVNTAVDFTTNDNGEIQVWGLSDGTYTLIEKTPTANYAAPATDITLTITSTLDGTKVVTTTLSGGDGDGRDVDGDNKIFGAADAGTRVISSEIADGKIEVRVTNGKNVTLPGTGMDGVLVSTLASGFVVVIALGMIIARSRRRSEVEED